MGGVATFGSLTASPPGTGYIQTASSGSLTTATSSAFDVNPMISGVVSYCSGPTNTGQAKTVATPNGDAGTILDVNGSGFGTVKGTVKFIGPNQTEATGTTVDDDDVTSWADDKIVCAVPTGAEIGTGTVYVKSRVGRLSKAASLSARTA